MAGLAEGKRLILHKRKRKHLQGLGSDAEVLNGRGNYEKMLGKRRGGEKFEEKAKNEDKTQCAYAVTKNKQLAGRERGEQKKTKGMRGTLNCRRTETNADLPTAARAIAQGD